MEPVAENVKRVRERIGAAAARCGRSPDLVRLVAVTKTVDASRIRAALAAGIEEIGENYLQEALLKLAELRGHAVIRHFIGHLQRNKVARAVAWFDMIQCVDSEPLARAIGRHAAARGRVMETLLEVNVAGEASKSGIAPNALVSAARAIAALPSLHLEGLMTVAPLVDDPEAVRPVFRQMRALRETLQAEVPVGADGGWPELSMGMTDDFEVAIEEGATLVRIGRAIFGERPPLGTPSATTRA